MTPNHPKPGLMADGWSVAKVLWQNALLKKEDEVPLGCAVLLRLHRPHGPARATLEAVNLGEEEVGEELPVLGGKGGEVRVVVVASLFRRLGWHIGSDETSLRN